MARNESGKFTDSMFDFFAKTAFISLVVGIASFFVRGSSFMEEHRGLESYALEGQKIGFGIFGTVLIGHFAWTHRTKLFEILITLLGRTGRGIFEGVKGLLGGGFRLFRIRSEGNRMIGDIEDEETSESFESKETHDLPSLDIFPIQPKAQTQKYGLEISKELPAGFKRIGQSEEVIQGIKVVSTVDGPSSSLIELDLPNGMKQSTLANLAGDMEAALGVESLEVVKGSAAGRAALIVGNEKRVPIYLRKMLESKEFKAARKKMILPIPVGVDVKGNIVFEDLTRFPHVLVAGATNSGKSVYLNTIIATLAYLNSPVKLKMLLTDPKRVEFTIYEDLPHVVRIETDAEKAVVMKSELVKEMDARYKLFQEKRVRNIQGYNQKVKEEEQLPYIVDIVDEYYDLMMVGGKDVLEPYFIRLGQLARGAGIHLIIATQRPSVDVITGVIKGNLPTRICFSLTTQADYATVFGNQGGSNFKLRGYGDGAARIEGRLDGYLRFQSAMIGNDGEVEKCLDGLTEYWRENAGEMNKGLLNPALADDSLVENKTEEKKTGRKNIKAITEEPAAEEAGGPIEEEGDPEEFDENLDQNPGDKTDLEYHVALQILDAIDGTPDGKDIIVSANKIRMKLKKNKNDIQSIFDKYVNEKYIEAVPGRGYRVMQEEVFYGICDEYEAS